MRFGLHGTKSAWKTTTVPPWTILGLIVLAACTENLITPADGPGDSPTMDTQSASSVVAGPSVAAGPPTIVGAVTITWGATAIPTTHTPPSVIHIGTVWYSGDQHRRYALDHTAVGYYHYGH